MALVWTCEVCHKKITPGYILCGDKHCLEDYRYRQNLPKDRNINKARTEWIYFYMMEVSRIRWY